MVIVDSLNALWICTWKVRSFRVGIVVAIGKEKLTKGDFSQPATIFKFQGLVPEVGEALS
jgi:hypothetical protein